MKILFSLTFFCYGILTQSAGGDPRITSLKINSATPGENNHIRTIELAYANSPGGIGSIILYTNSICSGSSTELSPTTCTSGDSGTCQFSNLTLIKPSRANGNMYVCFRFKSVQGGIWSNPKASFSNFQGLPPAITGGN